MRGLKQWRRTKGSCGARRIFYRCVDWNLTAISMTLKDIVASFTDAWIETSIIDAVVSEYQSHLLQMRGLKPTSCVYHSSLFSRIFYRCVDWNKMWLSCIWEDRSRIFYRCVDWNILSSTNVGRTNSRIFYRCVDWNLRERRSFFAMPSHLLQMRGLKRCAISRVASTALSHLLQMRGLKPWLSIFYIIFNRRIFYRCVDWNIFIGLGYARPLVASFTDAWIETRCCLCEDSCRESHLLQMRGLKLLLTLKLSLIGLSHLLQMRGLKQQDQKYDDAQRMSHLLQMRGLKPRPSMDSHRQNQVASFTDAWIETKSTL